jgi:DNA damage-binding protein 1
LYGRITTLQFYRPKNHPQDVLFVLTEKKHFSILGYDAVNKGIATWATGDVRDKIGKELEMGPVGMIDPDNRMIGMLLIEGLLKVVPVDGKRLKEAFNLRLENLRIVHVAFLYGCDEPTICVLFENNEYARYVKTYVVDVRDRQLLSGEAAPVKVDDNATMIIPVPAPAKGYLVIAQRTITYMNKNGAGMQSTVMGAKQFTAFGTIDEDGSRFLLGDMHGDIHVLNLSREDGTVVGIFLDHLGNTSIPNCICYLDNGVVFVGSHYGDSQLVKLGTGVPDGNSLEVIESYLNIGPIIDMVVVESERQGQSQVVLASGGFKDGSLHVVRSGIGIQEQASIEIDGINGIWSMKGSYGDYDKYLVQSFTGETKILAIADDEMSEVTIQGFRNERSIYCGNFGGNFLVQVTVSSALLIDAKTHEQVHQYSPSGNVIIATASDSQLILACAGGALIYLELDQELRQLREIAQVGLDHDAACMTLSKPDIFASKCGDAMDVDAESSTDGELRKSGSGSATILALGMWTDTSVRLLTLPNLQEINRVELGGDVQVRSCVMAQLCPGSSYLMLGLGDGVLVTFSLQLERGLPTLGNSKRTILGVRPISLSPFSSNGSTCVFASSDRPTVIYGRNGKLLFATANISTEVNFMVPFNCEMFPESLALCSEAGLAISMVDEIQKIHIKKYPLRVMPRRICHFPAVHCYAVISEDVSADDLKTGRVLFLDDCTFDEVKSVELDTLEWGLSMATCRFDSSPHEYVVVGTGFNDPNEDQPKRGRILVFCGQVGNDERRSIECVYEEELRGAVFSLINFKEALLACVLNNVHIFKWAPDGENGKYKLKNVGTPHTEHVLALHAKCMGDQVVIGDILRSVSLMKYREDCTLEEVARDCSANYTRAVEFLDEDCCVAAEDDGNLFIVKRQTDAESAEERGRLEWEGVYHLGDFVNTIRRGKLNSQPLLNVNGTEVRPMDGANTMDTESSAVVESTDGAQLPQARVLFGTVHGSIGTIISISKSDFDLFKALESSIDHCVRGIGGLKHDDYRAFQNERCVTVQRNTIDGDIVESFLDLSSGDKVDVMRLLNNNLGKSALNASTESDVARAASSSANELGIYTEEDVVDRIEAMVEMH